MCVSETANYRHLLMRDNMNGKSSSKMPNSCKASIYRLCRDFFIVNGYSLGTNFLIFVFRV